MKNKLLSIAVMAVSVAAISSGANAIILSGGVTLGGGSFVQLSPGFTESNPDNTVGNDTFQNDNLYAFNEDQNIVLLAPLTVNVGPSVTIGTGATVASHYVFFDPDGSTDQEGFVLFDANILGVITSTTNLANSDFLANTGVTYLNPGLRGLEGGDSATIDGSNSKKLLVDWTASTPGDYVRVLTERSPGAAIPEPSTLAIFGLGLAGLGFMRRRRKLN